MREFSSAAARLGILTALLAPQLAIGEQPVEPERPTHNLFGVTGLIDTPSAEMQPDGQISLSSAIFGEYWRNTASVQLFPGIEGAFRYSILDDFSAGGTATLFDRSFDLRFRVIKESELFPNVVVGLQDFLGTGVYSAEYIVGTKRFLDGDLALTGGLGWGRLGTATSLNNPLCLAADSLCTRDEFDGVGGEVNFGRFFQGEEMGIFGGISYNPPFLDGLTLKAEYSSDAYDAEEATGAFQRELPVNFGAEYRPIDGLEVGAYYVYGSEVGLRVTISGNPFSPPAPFDVEPSGLPINPRPLPATTSPQVGLGEEVNLVTGTAELVDYRDQGITVLAVEEREDARWARAQLSPSAEDACPARTATGIDAEEGRIDLVTYVSASGTVLCTVALRAAGERAIKASRRAATSYPTDWFATEEVRTRIVQSMVDELGADRVDFFGVEVFPDRFVVYVENRTYFAMPRAIGRTARAMARTLPASVETFEIVPVENSLPVARVVLQRSALEDFVDRPDAADNVWASASIEEYGVPRWEEVEVTDQLFPRSGYSVSPFVPINAFDPDDPLRADLQLLATAGVEFAPGISLNFEATQTLFGNLDQITRETDSVLPQVRSNFASYLENEHPVVQRLTADYTTKLSENVYARLSGGLFEQMFGGIGGEVLWKPVDQSWGLGLDINWVAQRDFDGAVGFFPYDVTTGHASFYWDTGFLGTSVQVDAGRYLAGDWGGTFTMTRRFANGWEIGAFFTLTDVPFEEFGEGSFDRGIILNIPFNWVLPFEGRTGYSTVIRPLTRDGGARLRVANRLYGTVRDNDRGGLGTKWGSFWE